MRLIDADELKIKLADELSDALGETDFTDGLQHGLKLAISLAEETPLVDAKPIRHGHWERVCDAYTYWYACSECGERRPYGEFRNEINAPYCYRCGAKMDEVRGEEDDC